MTLIAEKRGGNASARVVHAFLSQSSFPLQLQKGDLPDVDKKAYEIAKYLLVLGGSNIPQSNFRGELSTVYLLLFQTIGEIKKRGNDTAISNVQIKTKEFIRKVWPGANTDTSYEQLLNDSCAMYDFPQEIPKKIANLPGFFEVKVELATAIKDLCVFFEPSSQKMEDKENDRGNALTGKEIISPSAYPLLAKLIYARGALVYQKKTYLFGGLLEAWASGSFKRNSLKEDLLNLIGARKWVRKLEEPPREIQALARDVSFPLFWARAVLCQMQQCLNVEFTDEVSNVLSRELSLNWEECLDCAFYFGRDLEFFLSSEERPESDATCELFKHIRTCMKIVESLQPAEQNKRSELFDAVFLKTNQRLSPFFVEFLEKLLNFKLKEETKKELEKRTVSGETIRDTLFSSGSIDRTRQNLLHSSLFPVIRRHFKIVEYLKLLPSMEPDFFHWFFLSLICNRFVQSQPIADAVVQWLQQKLRIEITKLVQSKIKEMTGTIKWSDHFSFEDGSWFIESIKLYEAIPETLRSRHASELFEWTFLRTDSIRREKRSTPSHSGLMEFPDPSPWVAELSNRSIETEDRASYKFPLFDLIRLNYADSQYLVSFFKALPLSASFSLKQVYEFFLENLGFSEQDFKNLLTHSNTVLQSERFDKRYFPLLFLAPPLKITPNVLNQLKNAEESADEFLNGIRPYLAFQEAKDQDKSAIVDPDYRRWFQYFIQNRWSWLFVLLKDVCAWNFGLFNKQLLEEAISLAQEVSPSGTNVQFTEASRREAADYIEIYHNSYDLPLKAIVPLYLRRAQIPTAIEANQRGLADYALEKVCRWNTANIALQKLYRFCPGLSSDVVVFFLLHCTPQIWSAFLSTSEGSSSNQGVNARSNRNSLTQNKVKKQDAAPLSPMNLFDLRKAYSKTEETDYFFSEDLINAITDKISFILESLRKYSQFNEEVEIGLQTALQGSFSPPTQIVKEMCKVFDVTKENGLVCSTPDLITHWGLLKSAVSNGPVTIYWLWQAIGDHPILTISIRNIREERGRISTIQFPISLKELKDNDFRIDVFDLLDRLGRIFFTGSPPTSFNTCGKLTNEEIFKAISEFEGKNQNTSEEALKKVGVFFQQLAFEYRKLYLSVLIPLEPPVPFFERPGKQVLEGFMQGRSLLPLDWQAGEPVEPYSLDTTEEFFSKCPDLSIPTSIYSELGLELCVDLGQNFQRIPVYYQVKTLTSLREEQTRLIRSPTKEAFDLEDRLSPKSWGEGEHKDSSPPTPQAKSFQRSRANTKSWWEDERKESDWDAVPDTHLEKTMAQVNEERLWVVFKVDLQSQNGQEAQSLTVPMQYTRQLLKKEKECSSPEEFKRLSEKRKRRIELQLLMLKYLVYYACFRPKI